MNNLKKKKLAIIIAVVFLISFIASAIACNDGCVIDVPVDCSYDYPIKPGTPEWAELESYSEMIKVCQVPEHILQCMSTEKLTKLCLEYPLLDMMAYDFITAALTSLFTNFNGVRELARRDDAANYLCKKYILEFQRLKDAELKYPYLFDKPYSEWTLEEKIIWNDSAGLYGYTIRIMNLESLLGCSNFYNNISKDNLKKVLKNLWFGYNEAIRYNDKLWGRQGAEIYYNIFARANVIIKIDPTLSEIFEEGYNKYILLDGRANEDMINTLDSLTIELIK